MVPEDSRTQLNRFRSARTLSGGAIRQSGELRRTQRENGNLGRNTEPNRRPRGAETWVHVESGVAIAVDAEVKSMCEFAQAEKLGEKGQCNLPARGVAAQDELDTVLHGGWET